MSLKDFIVKPPVELPVISGTRPFINFDNAASTPAFSAVLDTVTAFTPWYSSVHRGSGFTSRLSTHMYEEARKTVGNFVGADPSEHVVIFGKNTTEAINKLSYRLGLTKKDIVLVSSLEHHSNDLPWRTHATIKRIEMTKDGGIDRTSFMALLSDYKDRIKVVAITGASNVTGYTPDIHWFAAKTHTIGAYIFVDAAQLAAHRPINLKRLQEPEHIDFIAISGHKMYAPYGSGALIGRRDVFTSGSPEYSGGGTVDTVTETRVDWAPTPEVDEAGSPNIIGAIAMAKAADTIRSIGFETITTHEQQLTAYTLSHLHQIPGITIYGETKMRDVKLRNGVISFTIRDIPHQLVAAILGYEWGIGVRNGCFCAQPYVARLLHLTSTELKRMRYQTLHQRRDALPGMVRISFGLYNTTKEVDRLIDALTAITQGTHERYTLDKHTGIYTPEGQEDDFASYLRL